jgi:hypothetical protein
MGSVVSAEPNLMQRKLSERDLKPQSLKGSNIMLHDTFGVYGIEEVGSQVKC